ncbi:MAG: hypothetical protein HY282_07455 [Nitrospirae bacterium]|nr:hypothetical protein [Candidatus Manganitrophaceae bacterium]
MKTYQNIFHGTVLSLLVFSGVILVSTLVLFLWAGAGMILGYPSGALANLGVSVFMLALAVVLFGWIYQVAQKVFIPLSDRSGLEERTNGTLLQRKRDQSAVTD